MLPTVQKGYALNNEFFRKANNMTYNQGGDTPSDPSERAGWNYTTGKDPFISIDTSVRITDQNRLRAEDNELWPEQLKDVTLGTIGGRKDRHYHTPGPEEKPATDEELRIVRMKVEKGWTLTLRENLVAKAEEKHRQIDQARDAVNNAYEEDQ